MPSASQVASQLKKASAKDIAIRIVIPFVVGFCTLVGMAVGWTKPEYDRNNCPEDYIGASCRVRTINATDPTTNKPYERCRVFGGPEVTVTDKCSYKVGDTFKCWEHTKAPGQVDTTYVFDKPKPCHHLWSLVLLALPLMMLSISAVGLAQLSWCEVKQDKKTRQIEAAIEMKNADKLADPEAFTSIAVTPPPSSSQAPPSEA